MIRKFFSVVAGLATGIIIITLVNMLSEYLYPPSSYLDYGSRKVVMNLVTGAPFGAILFIAIAWALGSLGGGFISSIISKDHKMMMAIITGCILMAAGLVTLITYPHPAWIWIIGLSVYIPFAYLGSKLATRLTSGEKTTSI